MRPATVLFIILVALLAYLAIIPTFYLVCGSISKTFGICGPTFTLANYVRGYANPAFWTALENTIIFAIGSTTLGTIIALLIAWVVARTNTPFRKLFEFLGIIPNFFPLLLIAISWTFLLNPNNGFFNITIEQLFHLSKAPFNVFTMGGMIFVQGLNSFPLAFLIIVPSLRSMNPSLEEASRISGAGILRSSMAMSFSLARPAILAAWLLNLVRGFESFEVPQILGTPARINVLTTYIYSTSQIQIPPNNSLAAAISVSLLVLTFVVVILYRVATRRAGRFVTITGKSFRREIIDLGKLRYVTAGVAIILLFLVMILPISILLFGSFEPFFVLPSVQMLGRLSLANYRFLFSNFSDLTSIENTFVLALVGASITMLISLFTSYIELRTKIRGRFLLSALAFIPFAMPGIVLGLGLLWAYIRIEAIYLSLYILIIAFVTRFLPYGIWSTDSATSKIHPELEEASKISGAGFLRTIKTIIVPLLVSSVISGWIFVFSATIREFSSAILLVNPNTIVASVNVYDLYTSGQFTQSAAMGMVIIGVASLITLIALIISRSVEKVGRNI